MIGSYSASVGLLENFLMVTEAKIMEDSWGRSNQNDHRQCNVAFYADCHSEQGILLLNTKIDDLIYFTSFLTKREDLLI